MPECRGLKRTRGGMSGTFASCCHVMSIVIRVRVGVSGLLATIALVTAVALITAAAWQVHDQGLTSCRRELTPRGPVFWLVGVAAVALAVSFVSLNRATDRTRVLYVGFTIMVFCAIIAVLIASGDPGDFLHGQNYSERCYSTALAN